jgi:hypothetical protein
MIVAFHVAARRVREATYLGMPFIFSPNSPVPSIVGHAAAKPSYVTRPSRRASLANSSRALNWDASSDQNGNDHLPGSSTYPSSVT